MPKSITYNNRTKVAQTQSQVQPPLPMTENAQQQPNQAQQFFNNAVSTASGYAARIPAIVLAVNRALFAYKIYRIPTEINQYIAMASRVGMTNEARFLSQALLAEPNATRSVFARAVLTYADARAAGYLANYNQKIPLKDLTQQITNIKNEIKSAAQRGEPVEELFQQLKSLKSQINPKDFLGLEINILENRIAIAIANLLFSQSSILLSC